MCDLFPSAVSLPIHQGQQPGRTTEEQLLREAVGKEPGMGDSTRGCGDVWAGGNLGEHIFGCTRQMCGVGNREAVSLGVPTGLQGHLCDGVTQVPSHCRPHGAKTWGSQFSHREVT